MATDKKFVPRAGTPLRQRVLDFITEKGSVNFDDIQLRFPEQQDSPLYRALRKLVADGAIVRKEGEFFDTWLTPEFDELVVRNQKELAEELTPKLEAAITGLTSCLSRINYDNVGHFVSNCAALVLVASVDERYNTLASNELTDTIKFMEGFLHIAKLLQAGLKVGFVLPESYEELIPELRSHVERIFPLQIEVPDELVSN